MKIRVMLAAIAFTAASSLVFSGPVAFAQEVEVDESFTADQEKLLNNSSLTDTEVSSKSTEELLDTVGALEKAEEANPDMSADQKCMNKLEKTKAICQVTFEIYQPKAAAKAKKAESKKSSKKKGKTTPVGACVVKLWAQYIETHPACSSVEAPAVPAAKTKKK